MAKTRTLDLESLTLDVGAHERSQNAFCVMEAVAYIAGEPWGDTPKCASPVIGAFLRSWNDSLNADDRNRLLRPLIPKLIGTRTNAADEETRAWMATDWLVRVHAPAWLDLAGLTDRATELRALTPLTSTEIAIAARQVLDAARSDAAAAWAAARDAARAAAGDAAGDAARAAAWAAAWAAAGDAARAAAWDALRPTVETLQLSALDLVERMILVAKAEAVA